MPNRILHFLLLCVIAVGSLSLPGMLAEEIQHGLDRAGAEASRSIYRGLTNDEFHGEVFDRILSNHKNGKFESLTSDDIAAIARIIGGLR